MKKHLVISIVVTSVLFVLFILSIFLHNAVSALLGTEDVVFWFVFIVLLFLFPLSLLYTTVLFIIFIIKNLSDSKKK